MATLTSEPHRLDPKRQPLRVVVYGDPGVGKTTLALTFPRPFVIDTDFGLEGDAVAGRTDVAVQQPTTYRDLEGLYFFVKEHADQFDTIVFDSLDGMIRLLLNEVVDQGKEKAKGLITELVPEQAEYLANQRQIERVLTDFRRLGKHMVLTSAVRQKDGQKRTVDAAPGLQPIINRWSSIMGELTIVRFDVDGRPTGDPGGKPDRVLAVDPASSVRECKTRFSALLPYIKAPSFDKMWAATAAPANEEGTAQ